MFLRAQDSSLLASIVIVLSLIAISTPPCTGYSTVGANQVYNLTVSEDASVTENCHKSCSQGRTAEQGPECPSPIGCSCQRPIHLRDECRFEWAVQHSPVRSISDSELVINTRSLGEGNYGAVYRATLDGEDVAVKSWLSEKQSRRHNDNFIRETDLIAEIDYNPNIIQLKGRVYKTPGVSMVTDYADRGCVEDLLRFGGPLHYPYPLLHIARDIADAMVTVHKHDIIHRDMKSANILLYSPWKAKLCDFGLSRKWWPDRQNSAIPPRWRLEDDEEKMTGDVGTYEWEAPEVLSSQDYDRNSDQYGYGVILWEMLTASPVWQDKANAAIQVIVNERQLRPRMPDNAPAGLRKLIEDCWAQDPARRPPFTEVLARLEHLIATEKDDPSRALLESIGPIDEECRTMREALKKQYLPAITRFYQLFHNYTDHALIYRDFLIQDSMMSDINALAKAHPDQPQWAQILAALAVHTNNSATIVLDPIYKFSILPRALDPATPLVVLEPLLEALKILSDGDSDAFDEEHVPQNTVHRLAAVMQAHKSSRAVQLHGARILLNLGLFETFRHALSEHGLKVLLPLTVYRRDDEELMEQVLGTLQNIALSDDNTVNFFPEQTVPATIKAARAHMKSHGVIRSAAGFLRNLCIEDRFHPVLKQHDVFTFLQDALKEHWDDTDCQVEIVGAIRNTAIFDGDDPVITSINRKSIPLVIRALEHFPRSGELATQVAGALYNMVSGDNKDNREIRNKILRRKHKVVDLLKEAHRRHHRNEKFEQVLANVLYALHLDNKFRPKSEDQIVKDQMEVEASEEDGSPGSSGGGAGKGKSRPGGEGVLGNLKRWAGF